MRILEFRYAHLKGCWHHSPGEGKRSQFQGALLKKMGMTPGWPDLEIMVQHDGCPGLFIEFKTAKGRQSPEQKKVQKALEAQGYRYEIVRSEEQFVKIIHEYLGPERDPDRETLLRMLNGE